MTTRGEWATQILRALGNPNPSAETVNFLAAWSACEFDSSVKKAAAFNPLATTQPMEGATGYNFRDGKPFVKNYPNSSVGFDATIRTFKNGHYPTILDGLKKDKPDLALNHPELGVWGTGGGCVERIWRNSDVRDQTLPGYDPNIIGKVDQIEKQEDTGTGEKQEETDDSIGTQNIEIPGDPTVLIARAIMGGIGAVLLFVAFILAVRTYVPTKQIVSAVSNPISALTK